MSYPRTAGPRSVRRGSLPVETRGGGDGGAGHRACGRGAQLRPARGTDAGPRHPSLRPPLFAENSTEPQWASVQAAFAEIERLADTTGTAFQVRVHGYASPEGTAATNVAISRVRADRIVQRLAQLGVDAARLSAEGNGVDQTSPPDRQRRVTFDVKISF